MKKIIIAMTLVLISFSSLHAMNMGMGMNKHALEHANPMPNLMRIAIKNADLLGIDQKQMTALKEWSDTNKPKMKKMIQQVMHEEAMLLENALTTDNDIVKEAEVMLETRKKIIEMKANCNTNLKSILTKKQYQQVVTIYRSVQ
jgi:Spy/CpxP family protein refolding chaperone